MTTIDSRLNGACQFRSFVLEKEVSEYLHHWTKQTGEFASRTDEGETEND